VDSPKAVQHGGPRSTTTEPSISNLKRGRNTEKGPAKGVSTWIRHQRRESRILIELRGNPFLSITKKIFG
jgi:hypothetical protein